MLATLTLCAVHAFPLVSTTQTLDTLTIKSNPPITITVEVGQEKQINRIARFCVETFYEVGLPGSLDSHEIDEIVEYEKKGMVERAKSPLETLMLSARSLCTLGEIEGEMLGFAETTRLNEQEALIRNVCTSLNYRKMGIGSSLMQLCMNHAQKEWKCKKCILNVEDENEEAILFYQRLGFRPIPGRDLFGSMDMEFEF